MILELSLKINSIIKYIKKLMFKFFLEIDVSFNLIFFTHNHLHFYIFNFKKPHKIKPSVTINIMSIITRGSIY